MTEWRLIREERRPGAMQMALDEIAAETAGDGGPATCRIYRWEPGTLSLGYHQDSATVDWAACDRLGVPAVRRPTGGGGIYHDGNGDVSYSIAAPAEDFPGDLLAAYHELCEPVLDAFDRLGVPADFADEPAPATYEPACYLRERHPAHDVVVGGRKISGNAQYRRQDAVVQHGSLTHSLAPERHLAVFADPPAEPTFRERVTAIDEEVSGVRRADSVAALTDALADWAGASEGAWTAGELDAARELATTKYATESWTRGRTDPTA